MNRSATQHLLVLILVLLGLILVVPGSLTIAQEQETFPIHVGVILPTAGGDGTGARIDSAAVEAARQGLEMATEELGFNARIMGFEIRVSVEEASTPEAAAQAAQRLEGAGVLAIAGGYGAGVAEAIAAVAEEEGVPFLNIGSPSIALRNDQCSPVMFHIEPSAGMYLDAYAGWFVGAGFRNWHLITAGDDQSEALAQRFRRTLNERHFAARITGRSTIAGDAAAAEVDAALEEAANADVVLLLADGARQLELFSRADELGVETEITAFPWPETQTREYYEMVLEAAPSAGAGFRGTAWEPTLDAYGARELNARFQARFGEPMDAPAWAAYQALKLVFEAVQFGGVRDRQALMERLTAEDTVLDVWKGIGVTFRPWNNQLRQTLFLVELRPDAASARELALLVGELPEIYMPRTDPIERLDQLGDLAGPSRCDF